MVPDNSPDPSTLSSPDPQSPRPEHRPGRLKPTHTPNGGCALSVTNSSTAPSSGTNTNSNSCSTNTSSTTTTVARTEDSTNEHPTTPPTSPRSAQTNRSNVTQTAPDSSTSTEPQPEPLPGQPTPTENAGLNAPNNTNPITEIRPRPPEKHRTTPRHEHACVPSCENLTARWERWDAPLRWDQLGVFVGALWIGYSPVPRRAANGGE